MNRNKEAIKGELSAPAKHKGHREWKDYLLEQEKETSAQGRWPLGVRYKLSSRKQAGGVRGTVAGGQQGQGERRADSWVMPAYTCYPRLVPKGRVLQVVLILIMISSKRICR